MSTILMVFSFVIIGLVLLYAIVLRSTKSEKDTVVELTAQEASELAEQQRKQRVARKKKAGMRKIREQSEVGLTETFGDISRMTPEEIDELIDYFEGLGYETSLQHNLLVIYWDLGEE